MEVCVFQEIGPFNLSCQIYMCRVVLSIIFLLLITARSVVIVFFIPDIKKLSFFFSFVNAVKKFCQSY